MAELRAAAPVALTLMHHVVLAVLELLRAGRRRVFGGRGSEAEGRPMVSTEFTLPTIPLRRGATRLVMVVRGRPNLAWSLGLLGTGALLAVTWNYASHAMTKRGAEATAAVEVLPTGTNASAIELDEPLSLDDGEPVSFEFSNDDGAARAKRAATRDGKRGTDGIKIASAHPAPPRAKRPAQPATTPAPTTTSSAALKQMAVSDLSTLADEQLKAALR